MMIFPAIDLRGGHCVRLYKGDFSKEEIFSDHPGEMAKKWEGMGAKYLHVVDLVLQTLDLLHVRFVPFSEHFKRVVLHLVQVGHHELQFADAL